VIAWAILLGAVTVEIVVRELLGLNGTWRRSFVALPEGRSEFALYFLGPPALRVTTARREFRIEVRGPDGRVDRLETADASGGGEDRVRCVYPADFPGPPPAMAPGTYRVTWWEREHRQTETTRWRLLDAGTFSGVKMLAAAPAGAPAAPMA
jgi:hypothetical protein